MVSAQSNSVRSQLNIIPMSQNRHNQVSTEVEYLTTFKIVSCMMLGCSCKTFLHLSSSNLFAHVPVQLPVVISENSFVSVQGLAPHIHA